MKYYCKEIDQEIYCEKVNDNIFIRCNKYHRTPPKSEFSTTFNCFNNFWINKECFIKRKLEGMEVKEKQEDGE